MTETCQRCGDHGEDRRTLWMSCLYQMDELGLPFDQTLVRGETFAYEGSEEKRFNNDPAFPPIKFSRYSVEATGTVDRAFYNLRVCKRCRADWMAQIKSWFNTRPTQDTGCDSGIFVRELGTNVEVTAADLKERKKRAKKKE